MKVTELFRVLFRLAWIRMQGRIDVLVFPPGGPQTIPLLRDLILFPFARMGAEKLVIHFHAAGLAERLEGKDCLSRMVMRLYRQADTAIVMTDFNRRDPQACKIREIAVIPHRIKDLYTLELLHRQGNEVRLLAMGHICADKGSIALLEAFAKIAVRFTNVVLEIAGEPLPPYSNRRLQADLERLKITNRVRLLGVVRGDEKNRTFGRAHCFIFSSVAPYESFGLVIVEAMMWALPMVVTRWRGNLDVAGENIGGVIAESGEDLTGSLHACLAHVLNWPTKWQEWGAKNRARFELLYREDPQRSLATDIGNYLFPS